MDATSPRLVAHTQGLAEVRHRVSFLHKHGTDPCVAGVSLYAERFGEVWQCEHWGTGHGTFEEVEGVLRLFSPLESFLRHQIRQWLGDDAIPGYKFSVVAGEAKEPT